MHLQNQQRLSLSVFFFLSGFSFSSWASRIPTIKTAFDLNEAQLGSVLLTMPLSSLIGIPFSGWLLTRFDSRTPLTVAFLINAICLTFIALASNLFSLLVAICLFSLSMRVFNIAINTQALTLQKQFDKKINGSFHALWSTGGIAGVGFTTVLLTFNTSMIVHLGIVSLIALLSTMYFYRYLLKADKAASGQKLRFSIPDPYILYLGLLVFFAAVCEGGMFDWSGIYFQQVIGADIFTTGYFVFMVSMALSRFISDKIVDKIGMSGTYVISALLVVAGISMAILLPRFWPALVGFSLVGFGSAAVIPMTYTLAGASTKYAPAIAVSFIATFGISGMLLGPPLIGYLAHAFNLRLSFLAFALCGLMLIPISRKLFRLPK